MGKITGFMEFARLEEDYLDPKERVKHNSEFTMALSPDAAQQQGARCMNCGVPFCNNACPLNNIIPDWNDMVYHRTDQEALDRLHLTNNFPEITGRICPAICEAACVAGLIGEPVGIRSIERFIADRGWENGWIVPKPAALKTGKRIAVIGSGPAGLAAAQQLARAGHDMVVFEKNMYIGGLLRHGIPDFKLEKQIIERRMAQMQAEGVQFVTQTLVGQAFPERIANRSHQTITPKTLLAEFDAVILAGGAEQPNRLSIPGHDLQGIYYAMEFLVEQNRALDEEGKNSSILSAKGKQVVVIGGGDTGADCVGVSHRHGARSVLQLDRMPRPPEAEDPLLTWPYWPLKLRVSSSHKEGGERDWGILTKRFEGKNGKVAKLIAGRAEWKDGRLREMPGSEFEIPADIVLLAMGFAGPVSQVLDAFSVEKDARGNALAPTDTDRAYQTSVEKVFAAGDMRRGQSLVVWAIREGRDCARAVDCYLMGPAARLA
ncbi:MAG: glutamate synthase subunit beta [Burkholderiaceae bacterium]|nr:glutamate synthase subunit beta [Burkholderiaceae bacterium]